MRPSSLRFALVLHTHLPYVRRNGVWPAGEDLFHQLALESYLPVLRALEAVAEQGATGFCTVGITPVLSHQMQDEHMRRELAAYLARVELRAWRQVANYAGAHAGAVKDLAAFYARGARDAAAQLGRHPGGIADGFRALADAGAIELLAGPATHPLLPLVSIESMRAAQLAVGDAEHRRVFGRSPAGMWIPECAVAPGVEESLSRAGVAYAVVDPAAAGPAPARAGDTDVLLLPRDRDLTAAVWSPAGYPAGPWYRDFHHYDVIGGFKNWRVTAPGSALGDKQPYEPAPATDAARRDAARFVEAIERRFDETAAGELIVALDTELLGHWWFEGAAWLEEVLRLLHAHPRIAPATLGDAAGRTASAPHRPVSPSSWGEGHHFRNWQSPETAELFQRQAACEQRGAALAGRRGALRDQMLRELLLLESSDWPYMIARDENAGYARERFDSHVRRFDMLAAALEHDDPAGLSLAASCFEIDNCFATLPAPAGS